MIIIETKSNRFDDAADIDRGAIMNRRDAEIAESQRNRDVSAICDCLKIQRHPNKKDIYHRAIDSTIINNNDDNSIIKDCVLLILRLFVNFYVYLIVFTCLTLEKFNNLNRVRHRRFWTALSIALIVSTKVDAFANELDKTEHFLLDKLNLEQSIAAVFNKVAYGSTTKRSIPDGAYPVTTLATPLLTTYRYSDGSDEWLRVDVKDNNDNRESGRSNDNNSETNVDNDNNYGIDLEKDHVLPTSAPAADILKNNNNKHYNNPNRYNNDRFKPDYQQPGSRQDSPVTENIHKATTNHNILRNVRPTKSMYTKDIPSYVPPSRAFFTPPLPPEYQNPFADKPTLRGTNSDGFASRRPIPPPSLMPNKDRIPFRPDLPKVNAEKLPEKQQQQPPPLPPIDQMNNRNGNNYNEKKKTLNTPSQNSRLGEFYGLNRNMNESSFEYEKNYAPEPSITRILSGSNGRHDDIHIPDILFRTVTAKPNNHHLHHNNNNNNHQFDSSDVKSTKIRTPSVVVAPPIAAAAPPAAEPSLKKSETNDNDDASIINNTEENFNDDNEEMDDAIAKKKVVSVLGEEKKIEDVATTQISDVVNLPNVKEKDLNVTKASSDEIWLICWNVHVYLVVIVYTLLAICSIYKLIRYENDPHMFSKSYFLTIHLMLTVICVLRIFYLTYDPYNANKSFNIFLYDFLHNFPLSLLATTFAVLILFLLKRTLTHLEVKTRPVFLVVFALLHIVLCFCLSIFESFGHLEKAGLIVCKPIFVLLAWALGFSYLYLYHIIKNVLAKKSQNLSEMCTQNISYASHITIAVALLFVILGFVQLFALFFIKVDRFNGEIKHHWILWGFELSVRVLEISIVILLAIVVSLRMSQREKQTGGGGGFPLFPCTTSDSSTDNIYPNNCNTNPNALNYSRNEIIMDNIPNESIDRPNLLKNAFQNDSFDKKSTLERYQGGSDTERSSTNTTSGCNNFERFERPKWTNTSARSQTNVNDAPGVNNSFVHQPGSGQFARNSARKTYDSAKYYAKPKYDLDYGNDDYLQQQTENGRGVGSGLPDRNIYSEPVDNNQYERTRHEFERSDFDRRSRNSSNTSGRRSTGRTRKNHARPHLGVQTLPNHQQLPDSMLVDEQGFVRFRHMQEAGDVDKPKKNRKLNSGIDISHFSDA